MTRIYTLVNQKGGVGKTTSAINLAAFLGKADQKVLLVDFDPQANATSSLGIDKRSVTSGTYEVLIGNAPAAPAILYNPDYKIAILPASPALSGAEQELHSLPQRFFFLKNALQPVAALYDYILIDCPPSLGLLTMNGLLAAQSGLLIPVQCEYLALEGLSQLADTIQRVRVSLFRELNIRGVIMTMFDGRTRLATDVVEEVRKFFPGKVFKSVIPRSIRVAEAPSYGQPISTYAPESTAAVAYDSLVQEILQQDLGYRAAAEEK